MEPIFFESSDQFRTWLAAHHATETEVLVGFHKKAVGRPTMTWSESVDQALCFGWIDGRRHSLGPEAYTIRFTPRKPASNWSKINVAKVEDLTRRGLMHESGLAAYARRDPAKTGVYSFENEDLGLGPEFEAEFRRDAEAWAWYARRPPSYRRQAAHWVRSAKRESTQRSRLATLIADSRGGRAVKPLRRPGT
jgi:uncharacterized protein YdeI (YjbR/CyaY-like superfamily)